MVRILLVEDELFVGLDVMDTLEAEGHEVDGPHPTVAEGLRAARARRPDLGFLDVRLADGVVDPLADWLTGEGVPLVFHSGHAGTHDYGRRYPRAGFCEKPSTPDKLCAAVAERLAG